MVTTVPCSRPVTECWEAFIANLKSLTPEHRRIARQFYMTGVDDVLRLILGNLEDGDEPTDSDLTLMDDIQADIEQYAKDLKAGRA